MVTSGSKEPITIKQTVQQPPTASIGTTPMVQQRSKAAANLGSRFDVLSDLNNEDVGGSDPQGDCIGDAGQQVQTSGPTGANPTTNLGQSKERTKGKGVAMAASNASILTDLQPLRSDQMDQKKQASVKNTKAHDGPVGVLRDVTHMGSSQFKPKGGSGPVLGQQVDNMSWAAKAHTESIKPSTVLQLNCGSDSVKGRPILGRPPDPYITTYPSPTLDSQVTAAAIPTEIEDDAIEDVEEIREVDLCGEEAQPQIVTDS